jgi:hypothetical protein
MRDARDQLEELDPALRGRVESELPVMFGDSIPAAAVRMAAGVLMVELPCGVEVDFERMGDGVRILYLEP